MTYGRNFSKPLFLLPLALALSAPALADFRVDPRGVGATNVFPATFVPYDSNGQIHVGYIGGNGELQVDSHRANQGWSILNGTALVVGGEGGQGDLRIVGNGNEGSATVRLEGTVGVRTGWGGRGAVSITGGGWLLSEAANVYLGSQGIGGAAGDAVTTIDGAYSMLVTAPTLESPNTGGVIHVGGEGVSRSIVTISNGGYMSAIRGALNTTDAGSILIGTGHTGSLASVTVKDRHSLLQAGDRLRIGSDHAGVSAWLAVENEGSARVVQEAGRTATTTVASYGGIAGLSVDGLNSSLYAGDLQIGGKVRVHGFTSAGEAVTQLDPESLAAGATVRDRNGNAVYDRQGNAVFGEERSSGGGAVEVVASTHDDELFVKSTGVVVVENEAHAFASRVEISTNIDEDPDAITHEGDLSVLTVRHGSYLSATYGIDVNRDGVLQGDGLIHGDVRLQGGTLAPGNSPGTLTIEGDLIADSGVILLEADGDARDLLDVAGDVEIGADTFIRIVLGNNFADTELDLLDFFSAQSLLFADEFDFTKNVSLLALPGSGLPGRDIALWVDDETYRLTVSEVPLPAGGWLLGSALFGLAGIAARRRA